MSMFSNVRKAAWAFLGLLVTNIMAEVMNEGFVFPRTWEDGLRWVLTIALGTAAVYISRPAKNAVTPQPNSTPVVVAVPTTPDRPLG